MTRKARALYRMCLLSSGLENGFGAEWEADQGAGRLPDTVAEFQAEALAADTGRLSGHF